MTLQKNSGARISITNIRKDLLLFYKHVSPCTYRNCGTLFGHDSIRVDVRCPKHTKRFNVGGFRYAKRSTLPQRLKRAEVLTRW